ncbi:MAG: DUF2147 domain-containing protein [Spirochaetes bacterium]|nr:DUF2147 domain-containing protein [Spirochaetota bacterium]
MKKFRLSLGIAVLTLIASMSLYGDFTAESILGTWLVPKEDAKVTIYKCGENFSGKITWLKTPTDLDEKNPDPEKRKNKILGMDMLWGFVFKDGQWVGGQIYDPDNGKTYKCKMWLKSDDVLNVRGYVGVPLFGRSELWKRVK